MKSARSRKSRGWLLLCAVAVVVCAARPGWAQPAAKATANALEGTVEGIVLALDGEQLVLDVGEDKGGTVGLTVEVWRPVQLKHPVTGAVVRDRYRLGSLTLVQVRKTMALADTMGTLFRPPAVGDVVILRRAHGPGRPESSPGSAKPLETPEQPPTAERPPAPVGAVGDASSQGLAALFDDLNQLSLSERIAKLERFARSRASGRFSEALLEEAAMLRKLLQSPEEAAKVSALASPPKMKPFMRSFAAPMEVMEGQPLQLTVELSDNATGAVLHLRPKGRAGYDSLPMENIGHGYYSLTISPERLEADQMDYFIEVTDADGEATAVGARADNPGGFLVQRILDGQDRKQRRMNAVLWTDYADFNRLRGNDRIWQTEGYFGVRFQTLGIRALRTGFGVLRGVSGSVEELDRKDNPLPGREVGLTYGYVELEVGLWKSFSMLGRTVIGLVDDGLTGGGQLFVRFGSDLETNLLIGGEVLGGVGLRTVAQLELNVFEKVPMLLRAETTTQPAGGTPSKADTDVALRESERGTRLIVQAGYRVLPGVAISARASVQSRTIYHSGPGFGGGLSYTW